MMNSVLGWNHGIPPCLWRCHMPPGVRGCYTWFPTLWSFYSCFLNTQFLHLYDYPCLSSMFALFSDTFPLLPSIPSHCLIVFLHFHLCTLISQVILPLFYCSHSLCDQSPLLPMPSLYSLFLVHQRPCFPFCNHTNFLLFFSLLWLFFFSFIIVLLSLLIPLLKVDIETEKCIFSIVFLPPQCK